jgi:hypothetical protein
MPFDRFFVGGDLTCGLSVAVSGKEVVCGHDIGAGNTNITSPHITAVQHQCHNSPPAGVRYRFISREIRTRNAMAAVVRVLPGDNQRKIYTSQTIS